MKKIPLNKLRAREREFDELLKKGLFTLWVFPKAPSFNKSAVPNRKDPLHLESYRSRAAARECKHDANDLEQFVLKNTWRDLKPEPVPFANYGHAFDLNSLAYAGNAPLSFWCVADLDNGNVFDEGGRVWITAFDTKAQAEEYQKAHRIKRENGMCDPFSLTEVSKPFRMWQVGYEKRTFGWQVNNPDFDLSLRKA